MARLGEFDPWGQRVIPEEGVVRDEVVVFDPVTRKSKVVANSFVNSINLPMPDLEAMSKLADLYSQADLASGADSAILIHPGNMAGWRTAAGIDHQVKQAQAGLNRIHNGILDQLRVITDPYCPLTVPRQFRFPRSKKKRIRNKWRKDRRNWRDERVVFVVDTKALGIKPIVQKRWMGGLF